MNYDLVMMLSGRMDVIEKQIARMDEILTRFEWMWENHGMEGDFRKAQEA